MTSQTFTHDTLRIDVLETDGEVRVRWRGKSNDRWPDRVLVPLMQEVLARGDSGRRQVVMDFGEMEYMNSSTFTPIVRLLGQAIQGPHRVRLEYSAARKWQTLSFAALRAFETADGRVTVHAK